MTPDHEGHVIADNIPHYTIETQTIDRAGGHVGAPAIGTRKLLFFHCRFNVLLWRFRPHDQTVLEVRSDESGVGSGRSDDNKPVFVDRPRYGQTFAFEMFETSTCR